MAGQITLLRLQRAGTTPHYTQGAATLYPGLCASALTARTAYVTRFYITCIAISRFAQGTPVLTIRVISVIRVTTSHPLSLLPPLSPWRGAGGEAFLPLPLERGCW